MFRLVAILRKLTSLKLTSLKFTAIKGVIFKIVSFLRMATSRNMEEPVKVKYVLVLYVHFLALASLHEKQRTQIQDMLPQQY